MVLQMLFVNISAPGTFLYFSSKIIYNIHHIENG